MSLDIGGSVKLMKQKESENRMKIEKLFTNSKKGLNIKEIQDETGLSWQAVKGHIDKLVSIGRIHDELNGNTPVYYWNGKEKFSASVSFGNDKIFVDILLSPWGRPYIRMKESKWSAGEWKEMGAIILDKDKVSDLVDVLKKMEVELPKYSEE